MTALISFLKTNLSKIVKTVKKTIPMAITKYFLISSGVSCFLVSIASFYFICSNSILTLNLSYTGFNDFQEIFSFPLRAILLGTTFIGLHIAVLKYRQSESQLKLNREMYESTNRPYIAIDKLKYNAENSKNTIEINLTLYNFGNLPAKMHRLYWELIVNTQRKILIAKDLKYVTIYPKKSREINSPSGKWGNISMKDILSKESQYLAILIIDIEYSGLHKMLYRTKEQYFCECKKDYFELIETNYELAGHYL